MAQEIKPQHLRDIICVLSGSAGRPFLDGETSMIKHTTPHVTAIQHVRGSRQGVKGDLVRVFANEHTWRRRWHAQTRVRGLTAETTVRAERQARLNGKAPVSRFTFSLVNMGFV